MHEIGVLFEVVKSVEKFAKANNVQKIDTLVLQIGELSSMIPKYMKNLYPASIEGTILEGSELEIEVLPANALCKDCNKVFNIILNKGTCPNCKSNNCEILSGKELYIKEIVCY
ncbi:MULTISPECIES: hydrogenase maturation nickel metallochaperone HypA [unclassified Clostridium]|uniref:hydrogenase maturation nickel metallochaperone HypA/HybF n=1 Tax=unclassified Clostridium TaxID=2614128 RepID=UPI00290CAF67|nr:hydrogenase maturation nickel metallochaperone HypA [Clostridium sp.]MDU5107667.1 hydrogenase maturation nickel metallochaperone HypA [Clostridium sp.]